VVSFTGRGHRRSLSLLFRGLEEVLEESDEIFVILWKVSSTSHCLEFFTFCFFLFFLGLLIIMAMSVIRMNVESEAVCSHVWQFCSFEKSCARI
jgi:hypothetical protein